MSKYTIRQVDDAVRAISGPAAVRISDPSWHRTLAMMAAATKAWIEARPEDEHSRVLRDALTDLNKRGFMDPEGGWDA